MSYRIRRAIGYGMPIKKFDELATLPVHEDGKVESMYKVFASLPASEYVIPKETYQEHFYDKTKNLIFYQNLLKINDGEVGSPQNLFEYVGNPDYNTDILFFPTLYYRKRWFNYDNYCDYAFEQYREGTKRGDQQDPRDFVKYIEYGHYPWTNSLMLADGSKVDWDHYTVVEEHPEWLPAVPEEIRWYLKKLNVLDDTGVNELRPILAQWWS